MVRSYQRVTLVALVGSIGLTSCFNNDDCTLIGCSEPSVRFEVPIEGNDSIVGGTVEMCHDTTCVTALIGRNGTQVRASRYDEGTGLGVTLEGTGASAVIDARIDAPAVDDEVTVRIRDASNRELLSDTRRIFEVVLSYPNGESCGPECVTFSITL